jgi:hypothetical protein
MPKTPNRYLIQIKDAAGVVLFSSAAYWDEQDKRLAVAQVMRLADVPEVNFSSALVEKGKTLRE